MRNNRWQSHRAALSALLSVFALLATLSTSHADAPAAGAAATAPEGLKPAPAKPAAPAAAPATEPATTAPPAPTKVAAAPAAPAAPQLSEPLKRAVEAWRKAAAATPKLVSLIKSDGKDAVVSAADGLRRRLRVLGDKTFSNREWRHYWDQQAATATALAQAVAADKHPQPWSEDLRAWASLAKDKISNQDDYLTAIERERDAIEERLESLMEKDDKKPDAKTQPVLEEPTPFQVRQRRLHDLRHRFDQQTLKKQQARSELKLIEGQLEVEKILLKALERDVALAIRERTIATTANQRASLPWRDIWAEVVRRGKEKVNVLRREAQFEGARERARRVEAGLMGSQIKFRDDRLKHIQRDIDRVTSVSSWTNAVADTVIEWLTKRAWRIAIGLLLIFLLARFALSLLERTADEWRRRAEGDPDDTKDDDQRTLTLIAVFSGVVRIAVYVVAGLVALEQIGVDTGPLLGSVAILGLAVSFGSQNLVRDVVNGLFVLLEDQYSVGDVVEISGKTGTVERITIRSTWIRQFNGDLHAVPNGAITTVTNMTREWARSVVKVGVGYGADLAHVERVCTEVSAAMYADEAWREALLEEPMWGGVLELGDSAVVIQVLVRTGAGEQWGVSRELNRRLKLAFDEADIEIPFPQRVVWNKPAE